MTHLAAIAAGIPIGILFGLIFAVMGGCGMRRRIKNSDAFFSASNPQHKSPAWIGRFWFQWLRGVAQRVYDGR